jgi:hypothetical protein
VVLTLTMCILLLFVLVGIMERACACRCPERHRLERLRGTELSVRPGGAGGAQAI